MMWYWGDHMSWWGYLGMSVLTIVFWALVIWGIVVLVRYLAATGNREGAAIQPGATPEGILGARFAKGEIDEDEYTRRLRILRSSGQADGHPGNQVDRRETDSEPPATGSGGG
jgi:putative membrane protein